MSDERTSGSGGGNGDSGNGNGGPEDFDEDDDDTNIVDVVDVVVITARFFDRFPGGLRRLADRFDEHRAAMREAGLDAVLEELREEMRAAEMILAGAGRGIDRILVARKEP